MRRLSMWEPKDGMSPMNPFSAPSTIFGLLAMVIPLVIVVFG